MGFTGIPNIDLSHQQPLPDRWGRFQIPISGSFDLTLVQFMLYVSVTFHHQRGLIFFVILAEVKQAARSLFGAQVERLSEKQACDIVDEGRYRRKSVIQL